jgi:hypothetical protein
VHKSASSFAGRLLDQIAKSQNQTSIDFDGYLHAIPEGEADQHVRPNLVAQLQSDEVESTAEMLAQLKTLFLPGGCYYGPIRRPALLTSLPHLNDFRTIILLRDPRDCLTSLYYSMAFSHRTPANKQAQERFEKYREHVRQMDIDNYVLNEAPQWRKRYETYCTALQENQNVKLVKYEQLVLDFPGWLDRVTDALQVTLPRRTTSKLFRMADFDVAKEDVHSHKRQVLPGDHRRKLQPETIDKLTALLRPVLEYLDYSVDAADSRAA